MERGKLILIEGPDTAGKSTQTKMLIDALAQKGEEAVTIHFPNYESQYGKLIKDFLVNGSVDNSDNRQFLALQMVYIADQMAMQSTIEAYLEDGIHVIMDRYDLSTIVYSAAKLLDDVNYERFFKLANTIKKWQSELLIPDLTVILFLQASEIIIRKQCLDQFESNYSFMNKVSEFYRATYHSLEIAKNTGVRNVIGIEATNDIDDIHTEIYKEVMQLCHH